MKRIFTCLVALGLFYSAQAQLVLNEVLYDPSNSALDGDANGDGVYGQEEDSFLEFYNNSSSDFDMSGYQIWDDTATGSLKYTVPASTIIPAYGVLVIFGGGTPTGTFGGATVLTVGGADGMNLNNSGEVIVIKDANGNTVITFDSDALSNNPNESYTRNPDITGAFEQHATNTPLLFSPGTKIDGSVFTAPAPKYDITFQVDLNQYGSSFTDVHITGNFNSYCSTCDALSDANTDGVYDVTISVDSGDLFYAFVVDGTTETLGASATCAADVSGTYYRTKTASSITAIPPVCWESCAVCEVPVTSISVQGAGSATSIDTKGGTLQMEATVLPANASNMNVTWSVDMPSIATIDANGLLSAVGNGQVVVKATADDGSGISGQATITISNQENGIAPAHMNGIYVYPNPANKTIQLQSKTTIEHIRILSIDGKQMLELSNPTGTINIEVLPAGIYVMQIRTDSGIYTHKLQKSAN